MTRFQVDPNDPLPRYYQVFTSLCERIQGGEFGHGDTLPPERQLVREYGVSRITIVKALDLLDRKGLIDRQHGRGTFVTEPTRTSAEEPKSIAFVSSSLNHPYLFNVLMGIAQVARRKHYHVQIVGAYDESLEERRYIRHLTERVSGVIVYPGSGYQNASLYRELTEQGFPLVMVDRFYPQVPTDYVVFDDETAGYELTKSLLDRGHERIAVLPHSEVEATSVRNRIRGFRRAMEERGIAYDENHVWLDVYSTLHPSRDQERADPTSIDRLRERLEQERPTALLTINFDVTERLHGDLLMLDTLRAGAGEEALGTTLEIAAFSHQRPVHPLHYRTTIALHSGELLGTKAAEVVIDRIERRLIEPATTTVAMQIVHPAMPERIPDPARKGPV